MHGLDSLNIKVLMPELFVSGSSFQVLETDFQTGLELPKQYSPEDESMMGTLQETAEAIETGGSIFASSNAGI